jgi:carbon-monoxide dehydrogenase medium subunit
VALQGTVVAESMAGRREIQAKDFFQGLFTTALAPDDLLVEVRFPVARPGQGFGFAEYAQRPGDLAIAGVAASVELGSDRVVAARLAAFGLDGSPQRLRAAEDTLIGGALTAASIERAARAAAEAKTQSDLRATAAMRTHLIQLLTERALIQAFENRKDVS